MPGETKRATDARAVALSNREIALCALHIAGGAIGPQDTEDIAHHCYQLAPHQFRWSRYDYPSLDRVKQALADARRPEYGNLVAGGVRVGWRLNKEGVTAALELRAQLESQSEPRVTQLRVKERRELEQLRSSHWFRSYGKATDSPSLVDVARALGLLPDTPAVAIERKISTLLATAREADDQIAERYLEWLTEALNDSR